MLRKMLLYHINKKNVYVGVGINQIVCLQLI